ncbi:MAG: DUF4402 domain-containing protein [Candidatus Krumholzibacteriia bacterium]
MADILVMAAVLACLGVDAVRAVDLDSRATATKTHERTLPGGRDRDHTTKDDPLKPPPAGEKAAITLHQVYAMDFGTLCDNDGYVVLDHNDTIVEDPNLLVYGGTPFSAEISITGDPFTSIRVGCTSAGAPGLSLTDFTSNYGTLPLVGLTFDATGSLTLHLGAKLSLSVAAQPGENQAVGYTVTATYESRSAPFRPLRTFCTPR